METSVIESLCKEEFKDIRQYSPLTLAFIGDGVYELYVRTHIVKNLNAPVNLLHKNCVKYVSATGQCRAMDIVEPVLTQDELDAFKRGRNTKIYTKAKNAGLAEYKRATGFEALIGYLYITKQTNRLEELITKVLEDFE